MYRPDNLPDNGGDVMTLEDIDHMVEEEIDASLRRREEMYIEEERPGYKCSVCGINDVDAENGYDTCPECASEI